MSAQELHSIKIEHLRPKPIILPSETTKEETKNNSEIHSNEMHSTKIVDMTVNDILRQDNGTNVPETLLKSMAPSCSFWNVVLIVVLCLISLSVLGLGCWMLLQLHDQWGIGAVVFGSCILIIPIYQSVSLCCARRKFLS